MAISILSCLRIFTLVMFVLEPNRVLGSRHFGFISYGDNGAGMCASTVATHGYKCQEFEVKTDDGYILSVQRIPQGRVGGGGQIRQPVLLQHGVLVDGATWLLSPPEQSLAMMLADNGFDVWISNTRGTRYSRRHVTLDARDSGTLIALASFSEGREIVKVKSAALLSPIAYLSHMTTALGEVAARAFVGEITTIFGLAEFNPKGGPVNKLLKFFCAQPGVNCYDLMTAITGKNCCLNSSTVEIFLNDEPQSTSTKNLVHLAQTVRDGILSKYDYGSNYNLEHYGETKPPKYNLGNIPRDLPLFLSYGGQDALSDSKDVETLLDYLKFHDVDKLHVQYIKNYAHADFVMATNANDLVYNQIISFFRNYA
ncbi:hypothetical protein KY290_016374 [Solanum tuberosum]|uniref:Lipase n=1 Tax=Solanum tuberosum TaxID=4113 RepID=A0ABQ7V8B3_SOLTU|nr:hypothetical protein KY290_016374 [Solanum tuberosum]